MVLFRFSWSQTAKYYYSLTNVQSLCFGRQATHLHLPNLITSFLSQLLKLMPIFHSNQELLTLVTFSPSTPRMLLSSWSKPNHVSLKWTFKSDALAAHVSMEVTHYTLKMNQKSSFSLIKLLGTMACSGSTPSHYWWQNQVAQHPACAEQSWNKNLTSNAQISLCSDMPSVEFPLLSDNKLKHWLPNFIRNH